RERIFESFYRGPAPVDGRIKGSGLGLAIAREYALAQGGRIEVVDRDDGRSGAWFRLSLPVALAAATDRSQRLVAAHALGEHEVRAAGGARGRGCARALPVVADAGDAGRRERSGDVR